MVSFLKILQNSTKIIIPEYVSNQTTDEAPVNIKVAKLLGIHHVGCCSHKLNNENENMIENDLKLKGKCLCCVLIYLFLQKLTLNYCNFQEL